MGVTERACIIGLVIMVSLFCAGLEAQAANPPQKESPGKPGDWVLEMTSTGGIRPRLSRLVVRSNGHFSRKKPFDNTVEEGALSAADFKKLNDAVLAAKLSSWKTNYNQPGDDGCCDRISTGLTLRVCGADGKWVRYSGGWYSLYEAPADLRAVLDATRF